MSVLRFTLNGARREAAPETRLLDVLRSLGIDARRVAVERNHQVLRRADHSEIVIADGDAFEVVQFVGGG